MKWIRGVAGDDHAGDAARFGDAQQRADVAGILHVDDDEREQPRLLEDRLRRRRMPMRDPDDAARRADGTDRVECLVACGDDVDAVVFQVRSELRFLASVSRCEAAITTLSRRMPASCASRTR